MTTTPRSNGKWYKPVTTDMRSSGARLRSYLAHGGSQTGSGSRRNVVGSGALELFRLGNGVFEEKGLKMLEDWEKNGVSKILGEEKDNLLLEARDEENILDLNQPIRKPEKSGRANQYDSFFD